MQYFFQLSIITIVFAIDTSYPDTLYLTENENYMLQGSSLAIPSNDSQFNILQEIEAYQQQLLKEQFRHELEIQFETIFTVLSSDKEQIKICFIRENKIYCLWNLLNEYDEQLDISVNRLVITTNLTHCTHMINYWRNLYLIVCDHNNQKIAQLIDENGTVHDQIIVDNHLKFDYYDRQFIFYEVDTENSSLLLYEISDKFSKPKEFWINYSDNVGNVIDIQIVNLPQILVTFEYLESTVSLDFLGQRFYTEQIKPNFKVVFRNHELICGIDFNLTEQFRLYKNVLGFSNTSELPIDGFFFQNIIFLQFQQKIVVFHNVFYSFEIPYSFRKIILLQRLPYIIGIDLDGNFIILSIAQNRNYFKKGYSSYVYSQYQDSWKKIELKEFNTQQPEIILDQVEENYFIFTEGSNNFEINEISKGIPFFIKQVVPESLKIQSQFKTLFQLGEGKILLHEINNYSESKYNQIIALTETDLGINIQWDNSSNLISGNIDNLFPCQNTQTLMKIEKSQLTLYQLELQQLRIIKFIDFQVPIIQHKFSKNTLQILLSNCSILQFHTSGGALIQSRSQGQLFFSECTQNYYSSKNLIQFNSTQITIIPPESYKRKYHFQQILDCDQVTSRLIIYELIDNQIRVKIYFEESQDLIFLYDLPQYNYNIRYPIRKQLKDNYLLIELKREEQSYIFIYNLKNQISSVLVQIIEIDDSKVMNFNFLGKSYVYYVFNNSIYYSLIDEVQIEIQANPNKYVNKINATMILESQICCSQIIYSRFFIAINNCFKLKLGTFKPTQNTMHYDQRAIEVTGIIGSINDIKLVNNSNSCKITKPYLNLSEVNLGCIKYHNKSCLTQNNSLIIDIFESKKILQLLNKPKNILSLYSVSEEEYIIIILDENNNILKQHLFLQDSQNSKSYLLEKNQQDNFLYIKVKKQIHDVFILQYQIISAQPVMQIVTIQQDYVQFQEQLMKNADIYNILDIYIICSCHQNNHVLQLTVIRDNYTQFSIDITQNEFRFLNQYWMEEIFILNASLKDELLTFQFIIFFYQYSGYLYEGQINLLTNQYTINILKTIRYGQLEALLRILYCSSDLIILYHDNLVYFYDLRGSQELVDFYYTLAIDSINSFEKYNSTHFIVVQNLDSEVLKTTLVQIQDYKIVCDSNSNINNFNLLLYNSVSEIEIVLNYQMQSERKISFLILLSINLITMIFFLKCYKKKEMIKL